MAKIRAKKKNDFFLDDHSYYIISILRKSSDRNITSSH